jgi:phosphatidylglycerol:prolipoprotein diacylglycerol transferase
LIPYFNQPSLSIGPVSIHAFGILVALGIFASLLLVYQRAQFLGLDSALSEGMVMWILTAGFIMAHIFDRIAYFPRETFNDPLSLLKIWAGISSFGGFIGAAIGALLFIWHSKMGAERWHYLDLIAYSFPIGWLFGRTGCFVAYDHPGTPTAFFLGQAYRDGVVRHNLGLEEALYTLLIAALFFALGYKKTRPAGFFVGLLSVVYAPGRFFLDYLRITDARYFQHTPGQYGSILLLIFGLWVLWHSHYKVKLDIDAD